MKLKRVIQRTLVISAIPALVTVGAAAPAMAGEDADRDYKYYACAYGDDHDSYWKKYGKYWDYDYAEYRDYYDKYCTDNDDHKSRNDNDDEDRKKHKKHSDHKKPQHDNQDTDDEQPQTPQQPPPWPLPEDFFENLPSGIGSVGDLPD